jgi:murein DD-endopeptidase MepM/ murein hydrolase activator NlpD
MRAAAAALLSAPIVLLFAGPAVAAGKPKVAALQVALRAQRTYRGPIDGIFGPGTQAGVLKFQRRAGLLADGIPGPRTRRALGRLGRPSLGSRALQRKAVGWDVAALQFLLAWRGFPSGPFDGRLGPRTENSILRFQSHAGLAVDGIAGSETIAALRTPSPTSPMTLSWPVAAPVGDGFGPRGRRFHAGIDLPAARGTPVVAAGTGTVDYAGWNNGFGRLVAVSHGRGVRTLYAHLSRIDVGPGERVGVGEQIGLVGSSGHSTGPHLHFEVHVRGAAIDPLTALSRA